MRTTRGTRLVGRERELATLTERLAAAGRGEGGVVLLAGEPGIGKTRLLAEVGEQARADGWLVLAGRAYDTEGMPPYLPFAEAIRRYAVAAQDEDMALRLSEALAITMLVPELREQLASRRRQSSPGPEVNRYRLFEAVSDFFINLADASEASGLLLCLDDLHWAERSTLMLFLHVARRVAGHRLLVVSTYRSVDLDEAQPLFTLLADLRRERLEATISLRPLSLDEIAALARELNDHKDLASPLVEALAERTKGSPFLIEEVIGHLRDEGRDLTDSGAAVGDWGIPEGVRQVIGSRVARLSREAQHVIAAAAVLGDGFPPEPLVLMTGLSEDALIAGMEEIVRAGMVYEDGTVYRFRNPLVHETVYGRLSSLQRRRLHRNAAEAFERAYGANLDPHLAAIATHYQLAGALGDYEKAIDYASRAGDHACAVFAYEDGLRLYRTALELLEEGGLGQREGSPSAELHAKCGEALCGLGRWPEARPEFEKALEGLVGERRAETLTNLAVACLSGRADIPSTRRYASEASALLSGLGRADLAAAIDAVLAECTVDDGDVLGGLERYRKAASGGQGVRTALHRRAFHGFPMALYWTGQIVEAVRRAQEAVEAARDAQDVVALIARLPRLGLALAAAGRYAEASQSFHEAQQIAHQHQRRGMELTVPLAVATSMSAGFHLDTFDLDGGELRAKQALEMSRLREWWPYPAVSAGIDLLRVATGRQEIGQAEKLLADVTDQVERASGRHAWIWKLRLAEAQGELALAKGDWSEAVRCADEAVRQSRATGRVKYEALALTTRGKSLLPLGRKREAIADLRQAVEVARPVGDPAMFFHAAAELLGIEGDNALAADALLAAQRIRSNLPEEMQSTFEVAEPVRLVYKLTGPSASRPAPRPSYPDGLSQREVEVLGLIAAGNSNREIAGALVLSVRTVERHIANIYGKTGVRTKAQATGYALRHNLS